MDADLPELRLENRRKNVFVTQLQENRETEEDDRLKQIPVVTQSASGILESGVKTLQSTLVLKKREELDDINTQLTSTRLDIQQRMTSLTYRRERLLHLQEETKHTTERFQRFVKENEVKRRQAQNKFQTERQENALKENEKAELAEQLEELQDRRQRLIQKVNKYKKFQEFMLKTLALLPDNYLGHGKDLVSPIIRRYETLSISRQDLLQQLQQLTEQMKADQNHLEALKHQHNTFKLMTNQDLSEMQTQLDQMMEKNKQLEMTLHMQLGQSRDQVEELGRVLLAVRNLAEQCHLSNYGPLDSMKTTTMMDMIKEFISEKADLENRALRLIASSSAATKQTTPRKVQRKTKQ